jgi:hypothetical protein
MLEFIEDTLEDLKDAVETGGGLIFAALLFFGVGMYFVFTLDQGLGSIILFGVGSVFVAILCYRIVRFFTGD